MSELKQCPFCGSELTLIKVSGSPFRYIHPENGCVLRKKGFGMYHNETEQLEQWNHRPLESALQAEIEDLKISLTNYKAIASHAGIVESDRDQLLIDNHEKDAEIEGLKAVLREIANVPELNHCNEHFVYLAEKALASPKKESEELNE